MAKRRGRRPGRRPATRARRCSVGQGGRHSEGAGERWRRVAPEGYGNDHGIGARQGPSLSDEPAKRRIRHAEHDTSHYQIGPAAVEIGLAGFRRISPVAEICNALPGLRDQINQTVTVAVWGDSGPVIVAMEESDHWITMNIRIGSSLPILTTAIGRIFLAHLPEAVTRPLVAAERRDAQLRKVKLPSVQEIDGLTGEIRSRRLSRAPSALLPGVDAIAAPVFDYRDDLVAVMCVVARSDARITGWNGSAVRALTEIAAQLSARLGYVHDPERSAREENIGTPAQTSKGSIGRRRLRDR